MISVDQYRLCIGYFNNIVRCKQQTCNTTLYIFNRNNFSHSQYIQINTWAFPYWPGYHPETPYWPETESRFNMGRGMITRPIWKCPCIKLFITYFRHLEKRHAYWSETKSRPKLARTNMGLDMEMIL